MFYHSFWPFVGQHDFYPHSFTCFCKRCNNLASSAFWKLLEKDVTTLHLSGSSLRTMLQRSLKSILEVTWEWCYNVVSRASCQLLENDVTTQHQEHLGSYLRRMLQRSIKSIVEYLGSCLSKILWQHVTTQHQEKSVLEVAWERCCSIAPRASWKLLEKDVTK